METNRMNSFAYRLEQMRAEDLEAENAALKRRNEMLAAENEKLRGTKSNVAIKQEEIDTDDEDVHGTKLSPVKQEEIDTDDDEDEMNADAHHGTCIPIKQEEIETDDESETSVEAQGGGGIRIKQKDIGTDDENKQPNPNQFAVVKRKTVPTKGRRVRRRRALPRDNFWHPSNWEGFTVDDTPPTPWGNKCKAKKKILEELRDPASSMSVAQVHETYAPRYPLDRFRMNYRNMKKRNPDIRPKKKKKVSQPKKKAVQPMSVLPREKTITLLARIKKLVSMWAEEEQVNGRNVFYWNLLSNNDMTCLAARVPTTVAELAAFEIPQTIQTQYGYRLVKSISAFIEEENLQRYLH